MKYGLLLDLKNSIILEVRSDITQPEIPKNKTGLLAS